MDKPELEMTHKKFKEQLADVTERLRATEAEAVLLQGEQARLQVVVAAMDDLLAPPDPGESMKLTEAIMTTAATYAPAGIAAEGLARKTLRLVSSKSADPTRVAMVRIGQLLKDGRLTDKGDGRLIPTE